MRPSVVCFWFAVAVSIGATDLFAHGGVARGPTTRTPGGPSGPGGNPGKTKKDKGPSTPGGGTSTPTTPPSGPTTPGGSPDAPTTPPSTPPTGRGPAPAPNAPTTPHLPNAPTARPGAPSTGGGGGTPTPPAGRTGGGAMAGRHAPSNNDRWETWWAYTRELYLGRHAGGALLVQTPGSFKTGRDNGADDASALLPESIRRDLLPVLARALRDPSTEVADSAAIALGRMVEVGDSGPIFPLLTKNLAHPSRSPQEAAVLALGILGGADSVEPLRKIALDQPAGRSLCGATGPLDDMLRGLAALALGLIGTQDAMSPLVTIATSPDSSNELAAAAVVGIGLQEESAASAVLALARLLDERGLDRAVRAQVPIAIARLPAVSARGLLPRLLVLLADKRTCNEVTRSLVLAIGHIATPADDDAVKTLTETGRRHGDASTRQFALLALGRIFENHAAADADASKLRDATLAFLVDQVRNASQRSNRPWAALALGLHGRGDPTCGTAAPSAALTLAARKMIETFEDDSDPSLQGALAIGLGLMRAPGAPAVLRARLLETGNPGLRGHLATSLGLLRDTNSIEPLQQLLADPSLPPSTRLDVARALALTGDTTFERRLLELFARADDLPSAIAYAKALGLVGGRASAEALRTMAEDGGLPEIQRSFAVVAIGLLAEKTLLPWNVSFLVDANYTVPLRPLEEVLDLL